MNKSLSRKVTYIIAIIALLLPLYALGRPKSGAITQLRDRHELGQTNLGELDPTSESMRLATLGLKGVASSILWLRADHYKEEKYFDRFSATLNQIALMQPHFISVWQHQAHNMSYNVSPEFEDYRQRYEWVKKGIDYLVRGTKFNQRKPILEYDLGHYVGNKLGKFDEKVQYRELFRQDTEFHNYFTEQGLPVETDALGYDQRPDNWRVGKLWFRRAVDSFQSGNKIAKTPHLLYSYYPLWQMYYGEAIQSEGILDDRSKFAWEQAGREWTDYGQMSIPWSGDGQIKLLETDQESAVIAELRKDLEAEIGDVEKTIVARRYARLPADLKAAYDKPAGDRSDEEKEKAYEATRMVTPTLKEALAEVPRDLQPRLLQKETELAARTEKLRIADIYRSNVNYGYWETRAQAEQKQFTVDARQMLYTANKMIDSADVKGAIENYEKAWGLWNEAFRQYPILIEEDVGDDVLKAIDRYNRLMETETQGDFVLKWFVDIRADKEDHGIGSTVEERIKAWDEKHAKENEAAATPESETSDDDAKADSQPVDATEATAESAGEGGSQDAAKAEQVDEPSSDAPVSEEPATDEAQGEKPEDAEASSEAAEEAQAEGTEKSEDGVTSANADATNVPANRPPVLENPESQS